MRRYLPVILIVATAIAGCSNAANSKHAAPVSTAAQLATVGATAQPTALTAKSASPIAGSCPVEFPVKVSAKDGRAYNVDDPGYGDITASVCYVDLSAAAADAHPRVEHGAVATDSPTPAPASASSTPACGDTEAHDRVRPALVRIEAGDSVGSGVIVKTDGYILTNSHVVGNARSVLVLLADGRKVSGRVAANLPNQDLALIAVSASNLTAITWGDDRTLRPGQRLLALGYALDLPGEPTLNSGTFSAHREDAGHSYVQTDTALNHGNSGGPLFTTCGEVIGIVEFRITNAQSLNFAISSTDAKAALDSLLANAPPPAATNQQPPPPTVAPARQPYPVGSLAQVHTPGDCLQMRVAPSATAPRIDCRRDGEQLRVTGAGVEAEAQVWLPVAALSGAPSGWVSAAYLQPPSSAAPAAPTNAQSAQLHAVQVYYDALNARNYAAAYALLGPTAKVGNPYEWFASGFQTTLSFQATATPTADPATVHVDITTADSVPGGGSVTRQFAGVWHLIPAQNGSWLLDSAAIIQVGGPVLPRASAPLAPPRP